MLNNNNILYFDNTSKDTPGVSFIGFSVYLPRMLILIHWHYIIFLFVG